MSIYVAVLTQYESTGLMLQLMYGLLEFEYNAQGLDPTRSPHFWTIF